MDQSESSVEGTRPVRSDESTTGEQSSGPGSDWYESVRSVADGIVFDAGGKVLNIALGFLLNLVLTNGLGAARYGTYTFGRQVVMTILMFTNLGADVTNMKFIAAATDDPDRQRRILGLSYATTLVVSTVVVVGLYVAAPVISAYTLDDPLFVTALRAFAVALPFYGMTKIAITTFRGLERAGYQTGVQLLHPVTQLSAIGIAIALGADLMGVVWAFVAATVVAFVASLAIVLSRTHLRPAMSTDPQEVREFFDFSLPFTLARAGAVIYRRTDVFMIGILVASSTAVGIYNIGMLVAGVVAMPLAGINQLFPSVASRLYSDGEYEVLESVYTIITRWSITASLAVAGPIVVYGDAFLRVFGPEFVAGTTVLFVLVVGQVINAAAGPSNDLLTMTDHQYLVMANHWLFGVANIALNYALITRYGFVGAAIATAGVLAGLNIVRVLEVWYLEGLFAYSWRLWKPLLAAAAMLLALLAPRPFLSGLPLVIVGSAVGLGVNGLVLLALGIDDRDREFVRRYVPIDW